MHRTRDERRASWQKHFNRKMVFATCHNHRIRTDGTGRWTIDYGQYAGVLSQRRHWGWEHIDKPWSWPYCGRYRSEWRWYNRHQWKLDTNRMIGEQMD